MGVYIKGMEMPTSCISCLLNFGEKRPEYGLSICCPYSDGVISWRDMAFDNGRLASCGIVPVPHCKEEECPMYQKAGEGE